MSEQRVAYRTRPVQAEADLQESVRRLLSVEHILFYEFGKPGGHRALAGAVPEGWADLLVILSSLRPGATGYQWPSEPCYIHLELKSRRGRLSKEQLERREEIQAQGGHWYEVRTVEEVASVLGLHGHQVRMDLGRVAKAALEE